jgi:hypothetical protein
MSRRVRILRRETVLPNKMTYNDIGQIVVISDADFARITQSTFDAGFLEDLGEVDGGGTGEVDPTMIASMVMTKLQPTVDNAQQTIRQVSATASDAASLASEATDQAGTAIVNTTKHRSDKTNPHGVTPAQLGLDRVENTSDAEKPVSIAQQAALDSLAVQLSRALNGLPSPASVDAAVQGETTRAQAAEAALDARISALATQQGALAGRTTKIVTARVAIPALVAGVSKDIPVTWAAPASAVPTATLVLIEPVGTLLGSITVTIKAGTVTTTGCTLSANSPILLGLGNGFVNVIGLYTS